jgi:ABC-type sugar transport system ATPase subunit
VILISHNMPQVFEVADRIHIQRLGRCAGVVTPQSHTMEEAVAIMTGATTLDGAAEEKNGAAARDGSDRTESTGTAPS